MDMQLVLIKIERVEIWRDQKMFIEIKNAKKQYGTGEAAVYALDGVDLSLWPQKDR